MKLLAIADLHAEEEVLDRLRMHATKGNYGFILVAGDITNSEGPVSYALELIEILGKQAYYVHGNNDNLQVQHALESTGRSVHARKTKIGKWNLAGFGGSNKTPFA
ncbi:metallophosphoesterase, partial [Candidatus Parvarchaeota archaeon]|nr:metallophosphoesterase [Candidatus Parvarchaeota archaeon]